MPDASTPEERARTRADAWESVWWHVAAYLVVNAFLWGLDWATGDGIQWAYWATFPWLIGLLFHVAAYNIEIRGRDRKYQQFLQQELEREAEHQPH